MASSNPLPEAMWDRHANPWSGWSRLLAGPALLYAVYRRDARLVGLAVLWAAVNPVIFPEREVDADDWMTRGVRAEQTWLDGEFDAGAARWANAGSAPVWLYALYAAYRGRAKAAGLSGALAMTMKLWFVHELARRHRATKREATGGAE